MSARKRVHVPPFFLMIITPLAMIYANLVDKTVSYLDVGLATILGAIIYKILSVTGKRFNLSYSFYQEKNYLRFPNTFRNNLKRRSLILLWGFYFFVVFENIGADFSSIRVLTPIATILDLSYLSYILIDFFSGYLRFEK